ncbi:MAG: antibiotic biosynthesis monooxygenase [Chloroflexota bacterium]|nr:antibiotic biosynthesis monooxygenase [Chloroflexota bacterium]
MERIASFDGTLSGLAVLSRRNAVLRLGGGGLALLLARSALSAAAQEASPMAGEREYLVIRQYQLAPGRTMAELHAVVERGFLPILQEVPGFLEYALVESDEGVLSISVFADQAGAEESTRRAADWIQQNLTGFYTGPPTVTTGSVWVHEVAREGSGTPTP